MQEARGVVSARRRHSVVTSVLISCCCITGPALAAADVASPFVATKADLHRLAAGECVSYAAEESVLGRPRMVLLAYQYLHTSRERLAQAMIDPNAYTTILPRTLHAHIEKTRGDKKWISLTQGNSLVELRYVIKVDPSEDRSLYRFRIDESYPHDLDDAWGFLRLQSVSASRGLRDNEIGDYLVSYGLVFDLGGGILQTFFAQRILWVLRSIPARLKRYVETQPIAGPTP